MEYVDFIDSIERASARFAQVLVTTPLATPVPACPGWNLGDLARHLGGVHRWARSQIVGVSEPDAESPADDADALTVWFSGGAESLTRELRRREPTEACSTVYPPAVVATWARRQALETALHLWDATDAIGRPVLVVGDLAVSGVVEVVEDLYPRQVRLGRTRPLDGRLDIHLTDRDRVARPIRLGSSDADDSSSARIEILAADALLLLWGRRTLDEVPARVSGSERVLREVLAAALVP